MNEITRNDINLDKPRHITITDSDVHAMVASVVIYSTRIVKSGYLSVDEYCSKISELLDVGLVDLYLRIMEKYGSQYYYWQYDGHSMLKLYEQKES